jgi:hypothetical protein
MCALLIFWLVPFAVCPSSGREGGRFDPFNIEVPSEASDHADSAHDDAGANALNLRLFLEQNLNPPELEP